MDHHFMAIPGNVGKGDLQAIYFQADFSMGIAAPLRLLPAALLVCAAPLFAQTPCEELARQRLPNVTITLDTSVAAGAFQPPPAAPFPGEAPGPGAPPPPVLLPAHCRVAATLKPTPDSNIEMELWLPAQWNGRFQAVGNGGFAGSITYSARGAGAVASSMAGALQRGYATASTDTGHKGAGGSFAYQHPEKFADFAWRA